MARELEAKVANVLSDTSITINVGEDEGVETGARVVVWRNVQVKDPDTGEVLGSVKLENLRLRVYEVHPRFSLARVDTKGLSSFGGMFKPSKVIASSRRVLDQEQVELATGYPVTVMIDDSLLAAAAPDDDDELLPDDDDEVLPGDKSE